MVQTTQSNQYKRVKTPTVIQMEAVECGAASLAIVLGYYGRHVSLEELRLACNVTRDGVKAGNIVRAARTYGLKAQGHRKEIDKLKAMPLPFIVFWNFRHFLVVEGFGKDKVYLNDPATGPRVIPMREFDLSYTGIAIELQPEKNFEQGRFKPTLIELLRKRLSGSYLAIGFLTLVSLLLVIPGLLSATFTRFFLDQIWEQGQNLLASLIMLMMLILVALVILSYLQYHYLLRLETRISLNNSATYFWHVLRLPIQFFSQRHTGEIAARISLNDEVALLLSRDLATTLISLILIGFYALLMIQYDALMTAIMVGIAILNLLTFRIIARRRKDVNQRLQQEQGKLGGFALYGLFHIEALKARGEESIMFSQLFGHYAKVLNALQEFKLLSHLVSTVPPTLMMLATTAILVLGGLKIMRGEMTVGMLIAFNALMGAFLIPINSLVELGGKLQTIEGNLNRLEDVLRAQEDRNFEENPEVTSGIETKLHGELELRNVSFGYNRLGAPLIENFNLHLKPGQRVALVGASGSGKSTVAKLISGLYRPWEGEILFDGKRRSELSRATLTNSVSVVDQDVFLFDGSVYDNLTLWDHTVEQRQVVQAASDALIYEMIIKRPGGYESIIEEGGRNLSGGQRQRLEIARALVTNPTILVLDEATSALDASTEAKITENLRRRGCTTVIIAHRLSTIRDADMILVLDNGHVVQQGSHVELYAKRGAYQALINAEDYERENNPMKTIFGLLEDLG
jgi:ATP-binding cassette subfamily C protein